MTNIFDTNNFPSSWLPIFPLSLIIILLFSSCSTPIKTQPLLQVELNIDGVTRNVEIPAGTTVDSALKSSSVLLSGLDRSDPPGYTVLTDRATINVIRVKEEFDVKTTTIPFEQQTIRNESLPEGEKVLIQPGVNGENEITYRKVFENGLEVSNSIIKSARIKEPVPEIVMIGVQSTFASVPISGRLAYLIAGNAWVMEGSTGNRRPVITTGDLDGRIFSLSPNGDWLLFTRKIPDLSPEGQINTLWVQNLLDPQAKPIDLKTPNVIHYASWVPNTPNTVAYSTVEPRETAPGWQANNDLFTVSFSSSGFISQRKEIVPTNSGGIYGWWGCIYDWSPDGKEIAYTRPDSIGLVDEKNNNLTPIISIPAYQTHGDWAWIPGISWSPDGQALYTVIHTASEELTSAEDSPNFDLSASLLTKGTNYSLVPKTGMFSYPVASPTLSNGGFLVAYLQAVFPEQSDNSRYRLMTMDQDGSNKIVLFPPEGSSGIEPQNIIWSPSPQSDHYLIAFRYQGNLWFVDPFTTEAQQITGDGLVNQIDWK